MRMNPLSLPHILPVQKASSECNRPSHRLLKTPQSLSVPLDIQIRYTMLYLNPSFRDFNSSRSPFQSVHIFTNILSFQTVPCRRARTDTHTSRKSCAPSRIHSFKMTLLFLKSVSIPHSPATIVDPTSFSTLEGLCVTYVQSVLNYRTHYMYHYCLVCVCGSTRWNVRHLTLMKNPQVWFLGPNKYSWCYFPSLLLFELEKGRRVELGFYVWFGDG